ncbi:MAG TPA: hemolysin family protein [Acidobacteriota bacterium]|nr:hemolysin family protein [Acidobacteriota bacterium]
MSSSSTWLQVDIAGALLLLGALFFVSLIVNAGWRLTRVALRTMSEKLESPPRLLAQIARDRGAFLVPLEVAGHALLVGLSLLTYIIFSQLGLAYPVWWALGSMVLVTGVFYQLLPKLMTQRNPEGVLLLTLKLLAPIYIPLRWLSAPLWLPLKRSKENQDRRPVPEEPEEETAEEAIQAYIGVGTEEGIIEKGDSELIQSALEFGNTLVHEIMTPRTEMVCVEESATVGQLREMFVSSKHSRLPVYREGMDQIVGLIYIRKFLAHWDTLKDDSPIAPIIDEAKFVPETKKVSDLLKELQQANGNMAIVINEYGAVTGLVTTEDLVEELVGEIHDEDEQRETDIELTENNDYLVRGGVEIEDLEDALNLDLGHLDVTTVSGLVVSQLGRVPQKGERVDINSTLEITVTDADPRRINWMRVRVVGGREENAGPAEPASA